MGFHAYALQKSTPGGLLGGPGDAPRPRRQAPQPAPAGSTPQDRELRYASALTRRRGRKVVVVLADDNAPDDVSWHLEHLRGASVHVISLSARPEWRLEECGARHHEAANLAEVNWVMRFLGPVDLLLNLAPASAADHESTWARLFFHVRPSGAYVLSRRAIASSGGEGNSLSRLLAVAEMVGRSPRDLEGATRADLELARSTASVLFGTDYVVAVKRNKHLLKVRDRDAGRMLPVREPRLSTVHLASRPAVEWRSRVKVTSHDAAVPIDALGDRFSVPPLFLRHYQGKIAMVSHGLVHSGFSILPESFRFPYEANPGNARMTNVNADFGRVRERFRPERTLEGSYFHLDASNSGHFGHVMTEVLSRLWAWETAKQEIPDLKAIFRIRFANERDPLLEKRIFTSFGIADEDIVWVDEPVWLESMVGATPMWHNQYPHYVHPEIRELVWDRLAAGVTNDDVPQRRRIFVSRQGRGANRTCRNSAQVEELFAAHGFEVIYPELLDLGEQAGVFAKAEVIAGFGGSALFNLTFARQVETLIVLNHEAYTAKNEHLYSSVLGCDTHYFWSSPDVQHPQGGWSEAAYYSDWDFDFERNRDPLTELLDRLE